jgi:excisionase family DNA binding protein
MLLTIKDLSKILNIKPSTLYLWAAQGKIPCRRIHGLIRFEPEAITLWLQSFEGRQVSPIPSFGLESSTDITQLIEAAKRESYTARGETNPTSGLIRKEDTDGAV